MATRFVTVERNTNPKSPNYHKWYVGVSEKLYDPIQCVFIHEKKSECIRYAKTLHEAPYISNGVEYGAKW